MGDQTQAFDIFQTPLSSGYPLPLRDFTSCVLSVWGLLPSYDLILSPLIYCTVYLFTGGKGGERMLERQCFAKSVENSNMTDCISSL